jgi:non-reducing end alpha-L-arabinofuranosidase
MRHFPSGSGALLSLAALLVAAEGCTSSDSNSPGAGGSGGSSGTTRSTGGSGSGGSGGLSSAGGTNGSGGSQAAGGSFGTGGGLSQSGGRRGVGGSGRAGGAGGIATNSGGSSPGGSGAGGTIGGSGGRNRTDAAAGGQSASDGTTGLDEGSGGTTGQTSGPCDIYAAANTPCVAAHSTVRALYGKYTGNLYQIRRASDKTTTEVPVLAAGGFADISVQDKFCAGTTCTISIIYDQSPNHNDLPKSPKAHWLANGGNEANASDGKTTVGGHVVHGIYVIGNSTQVAYRNNACKGLAIDDQPEAMYMVLDGKRFSSNCCFDYGNAETSGNDDGDATMEAIYWGSNTSYAKGGGNGPWVAADLENGMYEGDSGNTPSNTSITGWSYVTAMLKGPSGNRMGLKAGDAQSGTLVTKWDGARPRGYSPMKKQGAIILGTGGDGSWGNDGTFFEGAITAGNPSDATDDAIQANIVAAGYGR